MAVSDKSLLRYWQEYGECGFLEPGNLIFVTAKVNGEEKEFISPSDETDEAFSDRLLRSKKKGENLFAKEWEELKYDNNEIL